MRFEQNLLNALLNQEKPVTSKDLSFILNTSDKTVMKYLNVLMGILENHGAELVTKQRVGSYIVVHNEEEFQEFLKEFNSDSHMDDPVLRSRYVLTRLLLTDDYINIYDLADEMNVSPSLLRSIIKDLKPIINKYSLVVDHSHFHGYRISGSESDVRRCLVHECKESKYISDSVVNKRFNGNERDLIRKIIASTLEHFHISVSNESISSLTLHVLIAINRIETDNPIHLEDDFSILKVKAKPEFFAATQIGKQLESSLNIQLTENELIYLTMHISGQQRFYGHERLQVSITDNALIFYNKFLRNILQYSEEDFFNDDELRTSLLNHIVPFLTRIENDIQIEKTELNNIKSEFPYAYELAVYGLSTLFNKGIKVSEVEISYFALHLQLSLEKRKIDEQIKCNILVYCEETSSIFHMLSYKLNNIFGEKINEIVFTTFQDKDKYEPEDFNIILNTTNNRSSLPEGTLTISPYLDEKDIEVITSALNHVQSRIINNIMLRDFLFFDIEAKSREEVLNYITTETRKFIPLPDDFLERLEAREKLATTDYENRLAIPHPMDMRDIPDFIAVARLKEPIIWDVKQVQLVFLICNNGEINSIIFEKLTKIMKSHELSQSLINAEDFNEFEMIFEGI